VICLVHLVRASNGRGPFDAFVGALGLRAAGAPFELVLAFKGFASEADAQPFLDAAAAHEPASLHFDDSGLDLTVYMAAARRLERDRYCFTNSFSEPLTDGWLGKLDAALGRDDVGLAGPTGSWNSTRSWAMQMLGLPTPYRGLLPSRVTLREVSAELAPTGETAEAAPGGRRAVTVLKALGNLPGQMLGFEPFPVPHLRTNAFCIEHATLTRVAWPEIRTKRDAYLLESGRHSLTRRVERLGLRAVVVDRAGEAYDSAEWHRSDTFWQRRQEGLLVADNQTRAYEQGGLERRRVLATMAWGREARPIEGP
jgi:hypothetical protein